MKLTKKIIILTIVLTINIQAGWQDQIGGLLEGAKKLQTTTTQSTNSNADLSNTDMNSALKTALSKGVKFAINNLSQEGGYLNNPLVKIPLPKSLQASEKILRQVGGGKYVDDLILSLNKAATTAAPKTADVLINTIQKMSITDAQNILAGSDNAATEYFRKNSSEELASVIEPIIKDSMAEADVAKYYGMFQSFYKSNAGVLQNESVTAMSKKFGLDSYLPSSKDEDLDSYVTSSAINGLMTMIAQKEKEIRDNPLMQNSDLLKKVFSAF